MRSLSSDIITKSAQQSQTIAANAEPYASFRIARNQTVLKDIELTEKVRVRRLDTNAITDGDVAVCHPRFKGENTKIWCCYIDEGKLRVRWVYDKENITEEKWTVVHAGAPSAIACAICFDSQVVENARGYAEFVTGSENPFIFYVTPDGELKCLILGGAIIEETLALANVTDVSAVRGPSSKNGDWDLGLTVFFLMNGILYYRQFINGVWYDAEEVNLTIPDETIVKIDAFNTWDYRVGVQCLTQSGKLYQIITYTEGIGVRGMEHLELGGVSALVSLRGITTYNNFMEAHHLELNSVSGSTRLTYGHSALPQTVQNVEDEDENWGTTIEVTFDYPNTIGTADATMFTLVDSNNINYACESVALSTDGLTLILTFQDFNLAARAEDITLTYTAPTTGGLQSPAVQTASFTETFEPENLVSLINPPEFVSAWNDSKGEKIHVRFSEVITEGISNSYASSYGLSLHEYNYVPNGTLQDTTRTMASVSAYDGLVIGLESGAFTNTEYGNNKVTLEVNNG